MLLNLLIIIIVDLVLEFAFEKLNQSSLEPFEKIQAKTRYLNKKRVWHYTILGVVLIVSFILCDLLQVNVWVVNLLLGLIIALANTIFENTAYDKMRNTLR